MATNIMLRGVGTASPSTIFLRREMILAGITRSQAGTPCGNVQVHLFRTLDDLNIADSVSDSLGNYSFTVGERVKYYIVATKPYPTIDTALIRMDSTAVTIDRAQLEGVTINSLVGA